MKRAMPAPERKAILSENQKWAMPLDFPEIPFGIFRKSKMGYAPHPSAFADTFPPEGKALKEAVILISNAE